MIAKKKSGNSCTMRLQISPQLFSSSSLGILDVKRTQWLVCQQNVVCLLVWGEGAPREASVRERVSSAAREHIELSLLFISWRLSSDGFEKKLGAAKPRMVPLRYRQMLLMRSSSRRVSGNERGRSGETRSVPELT